MTRLGFPKPRPQLLTKHDQRASVAATDRAENATVKQRSGGQCERIEVVTPWGPRRQLVARCAKRASHIHHLISGIGRRNVGDSIKAEHKIHVCTDCHREIHGHVLVPVNQTERDDAAKVRYERVK